MRYPALFSPLRINSMVLPNRVVITAMVTRLAGTDGAVNDEVRNRYLRFAQGEPGFIVLEAMGIHDTKSGPLLRLSNDGFIPGLRDIARRIHETSPCRVAPQIIHFLKIARNGWRQTIHDLTQEDIRTIVEQYAAAAERARRAEFDAVELHMAHAYTISSFLSTRNKRPDEYGTTLENRMRVMSQVIEQVRRRIGPDFPIGVRFDGEECITDGYGLTESREMALRMAQLGVDYISVSAGGKFEDAVKKPGQALYPYTGYSGDRCMPPATYQDGYNLYLVEGMKAYLNQRGFRVPLVATGKIRRPSLAESILAGGKADLIGLARTALADPDWPRKAREGQEDKIVRCLCINVCKALDENFRTVRCYFWPKGAVNPPASRDSIPPTWPPGGPRLTATLKVGSVLLTWERATDNEAVYGYDIFRSRDGGPFEHAWATRGDMKPRYQDLYVSGGSTYAYIVQAYDVAGNRSERSLPATVTVPLPVPTP